MAKKISKKELLNKPDEFITLSTRVMNWARDNYKTVIWSVSGVVFVLVLFFGYSAYRNHQESLAHDKYFSALEQTDPEQKLKQLEAVIKDYPATKGGGLAMVSAGHLYYQKKDYPKAIASYELALTKGDFSQPVLTLVRQNLGYAYEEKGDLPQAVKTYSDITQGKENFLKEDSLLNLARLYLKMGKKAEARKSYQDFIQTFPNSVYAPMVRDRLSKL
jgi:predicted negative regulator of RcsB-dependent stress response